MAKLRLYCFSFFLCIAASSSAQFRLNIIPAENNSALIDSLNAEHEFKSKDQLNRYLDDLITRLQVKGYATASIDSLITDSSTTTIFLYTGKIYRWNTLKVSPNNRETWKFLTADTSIFHGQLINLPQYLRFQENALSYFGEHGYPFAKIYIDSLSIVDADQFAGILRIDPGPLYKIDSIRIYGNAKISTDFMQRYLEISNGSIYQDQKLERISSRIRELPYVQEQQPWNLTMLGTGSVLNLYLQQKKSSQVNVLVGFLPSSQESGKLLFTGEANINLRNALGNGEAIGINWQQLQQKSPRLDLAFSQPYLFKSPFGINTSFNLYKKDSSYININLLLGAQYNASSFQSASIYLQNQKTNVLTIDTIQVMYTKKLPDIADVSSVNVGLMYWINTTDYRFNPRKGSEWTLNGTVGTRKILKNEVILKLKDPSDPTYQYSSLYDSLKLKSYQFRLHAEMARYLPISKTSTFKLAGHAGWIQSPNIFRNELFQIGGYKLLRGFDEESIFASQYLVTTTEYRYLIGQNSFLFTFFDAGWTANKQREVNSRNSFLGAGLGLAFETKAGIFNISYAAGKRNDVKFDLRQSKIHLGFASFF